MWMHSSGRKHKQGLSLRGKQLNSMKERKKNLKSAFVVLVFQSDPSSLSCGRPRPPSVPILIVSQQGLARQPCLQDQMAPSKPTSRGVFITLNHPLEVGCRGVINDILVFETSVKNALKLHWIELCFLFRAVLVTNLWSRCWGKEE